MVIKLGRFGKFYACSNFPECHHTQAIVKDIGITCPTCGKGKVIERKSKKTVSSMVVIATQNANLYHGINLSDVIVQNVTTT